MAGFGDDASGFDVVYADNVDFSGGATPTAQITTDGQLLIGNTAGSPKIRVGTLTSTGGSVAITYSAPNINLEVSPGSAITKIAVDTFTGPGTNPVMPSAGQITITGAQVATGTIGANVIRTDSLAANTFTIQIQRSTAVGATDSTKNGVSHFNNSQFAVDANGFVTLAGGTTAPILGLTPDAHTAPGTTPVVPNGSGNIILEGGATFATGTQANPIRTNSLAANTMDLQIQLAGSNAASSTPNNFGVSQFDSNQFALTSGFVQLKGGGTAPALTKLVMDAGTSPIVPDSTGQMTLTAAQVATGTVGANVIRSDGTGANTCTLQIQRSTVSASSNSTLNGVCHFSSSQFGVDANGFVTFTGSTGNIPWTDQGGNFAASSNNGYFCTAALTGTLPATPAQGDVIKVVVDTASTVTIQANTGQKIRLGNTISALAGTAASTKQGDSLEIVYRSSSATWYAFAGTTGVWGIT